MDAELLSVLACPQCKGELTLAGNEKGLICESCRVVYPIREGVPVMMLEESSPLRSGDATGSGISGGGRILLKVVDGKGRGDVIELERGTCRALGRSLDEAEKTRLLSIDSSLMLDEDSRKIVMRYVARQFHSGSSAKKKEGVESLGSFVRGPDYYLKDGAVSRLHAMIFHDESGEVGILDMVSKNGTFVNGAEVESKILKKGDLIALGGIKIRFEE